MWHSGKYCGKHSLSFKLDEYSRKRMVASNLVLFSRPGDLGRILDTSQDEELNQLISEICSSELSSKGIKIDEGVLVINGKFIK